MPEYKHLSSPIRIGSVEIKNRMMNYDVDGNWVNPAVKYGAKSNGKVLNAGKIDPQ